MRTPLVTVILLVSLSGFLAQADHRPIPAPVPAPDFVANGEQPAGSTPSAGALRSGARAEAKPVKVLKTPHGGIQPQAVVDPRGRLHLIYFTGDPGKGDLFYVLRGPDQERFSDPIRVNSQPGSVVALGTIRGGQLAVGNRGRVHVAWNGSGTALPKNPANRNPMLYARLYDAGKAFEPQRNLMQTSDVLDGGGTVAVDEVGNVYVAWHALRRGGERGEGERQVWVVHSANDGKTFGPETAANPGPTGACACCGMRAFADGKGTAYLLYRAATKGIHRDMYLLSSVDQGKHFDSMLLHPWTIDACPMSSAAFAEGPGGVFAAWETNGQVYFARVEPNSPREGDVFAAPGNGQGRKHPALAANARGEVILVWTEGIGWQRGGALAWQVYDKTGQPTGERGRLAGAIPAWGLASVVADKSGTFTIIY